LGIDVDVIHDGTGLKIFARGAGEFQHLEINLTGGGVHALHSG
jgi:hypothetical protein